MNVFRQLRTTSITASLIVTIATLSACNGGSGNNDLLGTSNAQVRFINGSSGAGNVDVVIDGTQKFSNTPYGVVTNYLSLNPGTHSATIYPAGNDTASAALLSNQTFSVNSANYETLGLGGTTPSAFYSVSDQIFTGTYSGFGAVNFYNFAPTAGASGIQFGYYNNPQSASSSPTITALGPVVNTGVASTPTAIPNNLAFGFGAAAAGTTTAIATVTPSQIDPNNCSANTFACNSGFVSVFLIDGPKLVGTFNAGGQ